MNSHSKFALLVQVVVLTLLLGLLPGGRDALDALDALDYEAD